MVMFAKWASTILGVFAGAGLAANNPDLVMKVVVFVALVALVWTVVKDKSPDLDTVLLVVTLPSVLIAMGGGVADALNRGLSAFWNWMAGWAGEWVGTESTFVLAVLSLAVAYALMKRAGGTGGMPSRIANGR